MDKIDKWYKNEGLDRSHTILVMMNELLGHVGNDLHPSIWNKRCEKKLSKATRAMADLYQAIGQWEGEDE